MPTLTTALIFIKISHIASASNRTSAILVVKQKPLCLLINADFPSVLWIEMIPFQFSSTWKPFFAQWEIHQTQNQRRFGSAGLASLIRGWRAWKSKLKWMMKSHVSRFGHIISKAELLTDGLRWDAANSSVCRSGLPVGCTTGPGRHDQASTWQTEAPLFYRTMLTGNIIHSHDNEPANTHPLCGWAFSPLHTHTHLHNMTNTHQDTTQQSKLRNNT